MNIILASGSESRQRVLTAAAVPFTAIPASIDETIHKDALLRDHTPLERIAGALADAKALNVSQKHPTALVLGGDQTLLFDGELVSKCQDMAAARWAWEHGEAAGAGTGTLPSAAWTFWPLQGISARVGVAATEPQARGAGEAERFVLSLLDQGAIALERAELAAEASEADALRRSERLRAALLNSISHDLRTPLAGVLGAATTLIDYGPSLERPVQVDLLESIRDEAERLNRYVSNLLDMTRLEGGGVAPRTQSTDLRDVVTAAAERIARRLGKRELVRDYPPTLTTVPADPALLEQALVNILENAIAYSDDGSRIEAAVYEDERNVVISIEDEGRGIPTAQLKQVFEKFQRLDQTSDRGTGLGLAIAKGFVDAMGGRIAAASPIHDGRGTRILISLPKEKATPHWLL